MKIRYACLAMGLFLAVFTLLSCQEPDRSTEYVFALNAGQIGKFDSVRVDILDSAGILVHSKSFPLSPASQEIRWTLSEKAPPKFSAVVTGYKNHQILYNKRYGYADGKAKPNPENLLDTVPAVLDTNTVVDTTAVVDSIPKAIKVQSVQVADMAGNRKDLLSPKINVLPGNAANKAVRLVSLHPDTVEVQGEKLVAKRVGRAVIEAKSADGGAETTFTVTVHPLSDFTATFTDDMLPIIKAKCNQCHTQGALNYTDSSVFLAKGVSATARLQIPPGGTGYMPLNDSLSSVQLKAMLNWLNRHVVRLKSITVVDTSIALFDTVAPPVVWNPANASNQFFTLVSSDSSKVLPLGDKLAAKALGASELGITTEDGSFTGTFQVSVSLEFERDIKPIVLNKCAPCHTSGTGVLNYLDTTTFISKAESAIHRLQLPDTNKLYMPLGPKLTPVQLERVLAWLRSKVNK